MRLESRNAAAAWLTERLGREVSEARLRQMELREDLPAFRVESSGGYVARALVFIAARDRGVTPSEIRTARGGDVTGREFIIKGIVRDADGERVGDRFSQLAKVGVQVVEAAGVERAERLLEAGRPPGARPVTASRATQTPAEARAREERYLATEALLHEGNHELLTGKTTTERANELTSGEKVVGAYNRYAAEATLAGRRPLKFTEWAEADRILNPERHAAYSAELDHRTPEAARAKAIEAARKAKTVEASRQLAPVTSQAPAPRVKAAEVVLHDRQGRRLVDARRRNALAAAQAGAWPEGVEARDHWNRRVPANRVDFT